MRYSPPLDGLRALAVAGVLVFHIGPRWLPGGFVGVDVFYVLSGYLITGLLLRDLGAGRFRYGEFYRRRIQRLLPNLTAMIAVTMLAWQLGSLPSEAAATARHAGWSLVSLSNVFIWRNFGGYWGDGAEWAALTHTWSLGIEEQFYLVFPFLLALLWRFERSRCTAWLSGLTVASFAACVWLTPRYPEAAFYLLPTRLWELAIGGWLASLASERGEAAEAPHRLAEPGAWIGLAVIAGAFWWTPAGTRFPGWAAAVPVLGTTATLWGVTRGSTGAARTLGHPLLVWIGRRSYSLYLWHWPAIILGRTIAVLHGGAERTGAIVGGGVGVVCAIVAYEWVEQPLRRRDGSSGAQQRRLRAIGAGFVVVLAMAIGLGRRIPVADPEGRFDRVEYRGEAYNSGTSTAEEFARDRGLSDVHVPAEVPPSEGWRRGGLIHRWGDDTPRVVVIGSSHALMYSSQLDSLAHERGATIAFFGMPEDPGIGPPRRGRNFSTEDSAAAFRRLRDSLIARWHPALLVVADRWDARGTPADGARLVAQAVAGFAPQVAHIALVAQPPVLRWQQTFNLREFVTVGMRRDGQIPMLAEDAHAPQRRSMALALDAMAARSPRVHVVHTDAVFRAADGSVRFLDGRAFWYLDDDHLTEAGARLLRPAFAAVMDAALRSADAAPPALGGRGTRP